MSEGTLIPFGKYEGRDIDEIRNRDPQYLQWLSMQPWFKEKYGGLYNIVINNNTFSVEATETPEHNAAQIRFLDDKVCMRLANNFNVKALSVRYTKFEVYGWDVVTVFNIEKNEESDNHAMWALFIECKTSMGDDYPAVLRQLKAQRERVNKDRISRSNLQMFDYGFRSFVCLVDAFDAEGATFEQVRKMFWSDHFSLVRTPS